MSNEEIRFLINRAAYHIENERNFSESFFNRLVSHAEHQGDATELCEVGIITASRLLDKGQVAEAINILDRLLPYCAHLPQYQVFYKNQINRANFVLEQHGHCSDDSALFVVGYERLKQVGQVGVLNHILAVEHLYRLSRRDEAIELWQSLDKTAPNAPGVQYWGKVLFGTLENSYKSQKGAPVVPVEKINFSEISERMHYLQQLMSAVEEGREKEVINRVDEVLNQTPDLNDKTSEFYFAAGASLYTAGKKLDAFPYIQQLVDRFPSQIHYRRLFLRLCGELYSAADDWSLNDRKAPVLMQFFNVLHDHYYVPINLLLAVAEQKVELGEVAQAKELLVQRLELSPNDPDYLGAALQLAKKISDKEWFRKLQGRLEALLSMRPYDLNLQLVRKEFNFRMTPEDKGLS